MNSVASRWLTAIVLAVLTCCSSELARADVVSPPPSGVCPEGTRSNAHHGMDPASCTVLSCTADGDCTGGDVCAELPLCTDGNWATASCPMGDECQGEPCTRVRVCASPAAAAQAAGDGDDGCSCRLVASTVRQGGAFAALVAVVLLARRRSRRRLPRVHSTLVRPRR